ncbi:MAG: phosphoenolpyruvate--protein phosphotransferase, partial [Ignavibacteria bacterium]
KKSVAFIVDDEISKYQQIMFNSDVEYLKERSYDIEDIKNRIIRNLSKKKWVSRIENDVAVISKSISPADTLLFTRVNAKGYVTDFGGLTSHAAIVARSLNIPAVVGTHDATNLIKDGDTIIIDGYHGEVIINPTQDQLDYYKAKIEKLHKYDEELRKLKDEPARTLDGREIELTANIDLMKEVEIAIANGASGVGLVRTEQIFDLMDEFPDEEEQYKIYKSLAEKIYPNEVTIRTFDIGGDKVLPIDLKEPNPFLGWRGIRFLLDNRELFHSQLKAILRANKYGNLKVMVPMIASIKEINETKSHLKQAVEELKAEGKEYNEHLQLGIMVEVPSAAVMADTFAKHVDFISIGTNDLIQYLLAVDRGNENVSDQYQEFHPAVIRSLYYIIQGGKKGKAFTTICGEMAADPMAVPLLVGLGLDSISVSPAAIPHTKKIIRSINFKDAKKIAEECLQMETENEIKEVLKKFYDKEVEDEIEKIF